MAIFASFVHCLTNILHTWPHASFHVIQLSMTLGIFQGHWTVSHQFLKNGVWYGKSYYRLLIGNHTLAFDWCHFWWPWSTFKGHFSLGCHFHVHFSNPWHAFASHGLPAIAELLVESITAICRRSDMPLWPLTSYQKIMLLECSIKWWRWVTFESPISHWIAFDDPNRKIQNTSHTQTDYLA